MNATFSLMEQLRKEREEREQRMRQAGRQVQSAAAMPVGGGLRNPGQSLGGMLSNPTPQQQNTLLQMSLQMMGHDPTTMPGQTLAKAVSSGTEMMQNNRNLQREAAMQQAETRYGMESEMSDMAIRGQQADNQRMFAEQEQAGSGKRDYKKGPDGFYRYTDTQELVFPKAVRAEQDKAAEQARMEAEAANAEAAKAKESGLDFVRNELRRAINVNVSLDKAADNVSFWNSGLPGKVLRGVGGTSAADMDALITNVKSNIGFDRLQEMRKDPDNTTGGALGQVAIKELEFLQAAMGSLEQAQGKEQLRRSLRAVKESYERSIAEMKKDFAKAGGNVGELEEFADRIREIRMGPTGESMRVGKHKVWVE